MSSCVSLFFSSWKPQQSIKKTTYQPFLFFLKDRDIPLKCIGEDRMEVPKLTNNQPAFYL